MIDAHIDKAVFVNQIIDAIRQRFAISEGKKVLYVDGCLFSFGLPLPSIVLKGANQFLFLAIN